MSCAFAFCFVKSSLEKSKGVLEQEGCFAKLGFNRLSWTCGCLWVLRRKRDGDF